MKPKDFFSIIALSFLMITGHHAHAKTNQKQVITYLFPANKDKIFSETVDQFYEALRKRSYPVHQEFYRKHHEFFKKYKNKFGSMETELFKDMPDASVNFRKKMLFREVEKLNYVTWDGNGILTAFPDLQMKYHQAISPDRQVYFFASFKDADQEFRGRCAVYDVETKRLIGGRQTYINKYPNRKN